jgi:hypothetical protein
MNTHFIPIICISLLSACSGNGVKDTDSIQQASIQQAKTHEQTPQVVIAQSQDLQIEAQREDLYLYSPSYMSQAEEALESAEDAIKDKKPNHEIIAFALTAQKLFKRGLENKTTVSSHLKLSFDGLAMLKEINTGEVLTSDFQDVKDDLKDLIILIEQGKATNAISEQKSLLVDIAQLEIKTLKKVYLKNAEDALDKAEDSDAEDFASKSYEAAEKSIEKLELFISTSPKQRKAIKDKSVAATNEALHAENVAKAAKPLLKLNPETAEDHILFIEGLLNRIAVSLNNSDISNLSLEYQSIAIAQTAETINKRATTQVNISTQVEALHTEKESLLTTIKNLKEQLNQETEIEPSVLAAEEPSAVDGLLVDTPVADTPVAETPVAETPAAEKTLVEAPIVKEPAAEAAVIEEPVAEEPAAEAPVPEKTVAEETVAEEPVAEEPVAEEPVVETLPITTP